MHFCNYISFHFLQQDPWLGSLKVNSKKFCIAIFETEQIRLTKLLNCCTPLIQSLGYSLRKDLFLDCCFEENLFKEHLKLMLIKM